MSDGAAVIGACLLLAAGWVWRGRVPPARPLDPPTITQPAPVPVKPTWPAVPSTGVWMLLMDADEKHLVASEYVPAAKRPFKARYEGREYLAARGSVGEGYFIYRGVDRGAD